MNPAVILLFCAISYANADQSVTSDDPNFSTLGKHFTGIPFLLLTLATKEEVIHMLLSNFHKELRETPKNDATQNTLSYSRDDHLDLVDRYLKDYDETSGKVSSEFVKQTSPLRPQHVAWNPLATYHMIRRFSKDLKTLLQGLNLSDVAHLSTYHHIMQVMKGFGWPSEEDLKNQMSAILRVQYVYDLSSNELASGKIHDRVTNIELQGSDCLSIGKHALATNYYALAIEWLELAVQKLNNKSTPIKQIAEAELEHAITVHDLLWAKAESSDTLYYVDKVSEQRQGRVKRRKLQFDTFRGNKTFDFRDINFWGLCSGENYQDPQEKQKLFCYYESKISNNAWAIRPVKVEILSMNPLIVQYYDMIGDQMIERLKQEAEPSLARSGVVDPARPGSTKLSEVRTSTNTWIKDHLLEPFITISKRISAITGMNVGGPPAAEDLQVASYAFGGHYGLHADFFGNPAVAGVGGDRIATFMFYLSDVEKGGSTAFPIVGVAATPVKGSAVYWYNLLSSGDIDHRTWHGACPVIMGEKWVSNKWMRVDEQIHTYKCQPAGRVPIPFEVNGKPLVFDEATLFAKQ